MTENAAVYVNPIGGQDLYAREEFAQSGLKIEFLESNIVVYDQPVSEFVPNLSIIDLLMFNELDQLKSSLNGFCLI